MERESTVGRRFHRQAAATGNALSPKVDSQVHQTSRELGQGETIS